MGTLSVEWISPETSLGCARNDSFCSALDSTSSDRCGKPTQGLGQLALELGRGGGGLHRRHGGESQLLSLGNKIPVAGPCLSRLIFAVLCLRIHTLTRGSFTWPWARMHRPTHTCTCRALFFRARLHTPLSASSDLCPPPPFVAQT